MQDIFLPKVIVQPNLTLKIIDHSISHQLYRLIEKNRLTLREWLSWVDLTKDHEGTKKLIDIYQNRFITFSTPTYCIYVQNKLAGIIGFNQIDWQNKIGLIGYWLAEEFRGQNVMNIVCKKFIDFSFYDLHLESLEIHCGVENIRSQNVALKNGFSLVEKKIHGEWLYDRYIDLYIYRLSSK